MAGHANLQNKNYILKGWNKDELTDMSIYLIMMRLL